MTLTAPSPDSGTTKQREKPPPSALVTLFTFLVGMAYLGSLLYALTNASAEVWGALLLVPVLIGITAPFLLAAARKEPDIRFARLLMVALVLKLFGACIRYAVSFDLYGGQADAKAYDKAGRLLAAGFRAGHFDFGEGAINGTHFLEVVTGIVYTITGPTQLGGFFVFSWLSFLGLFFFYRAFSLAVPHGDHRRYALLVFFIPSLLFWSSSIGKESWMTLTLGMVAYGAARAFMRKPFGFVFLALGLWGTEVVRPHMALLILGGLFPAYLLRRAPRFAEISPVKRKQSLKIVGLVVLVIAITITLGGVEQRFRLDNTGSAAASSVFDKTQDQTTQGGSSFTPSRVHSPVQFPMALMTVLFRPFPTEAGNTQGRFSALEGAFLIFLTLASWRRVSKVLKEMVSTPYLIFAVIYMLVFIYAFSTIGNFGILVRQRVQVYPLFFVILALPKPARASDDERLPRLYGAR